jgi:hypothetical protein
VSKRTSFIFFVLVGYIVLQFLWWEVLLVRQSNNIISLKQNLAALSSSDDKIILRDIAELQHKKTTQVYMIVGEGTVFLLSLFKFSKELANFEYFRGVKIIGNAIVIN